MKEIPLTQGKVALVDDEDFEFLTQWKWSLARHKDGIHNNNYAYRQSEFTDSIRRSIKMHRLIMGLQSGDNQHTDHINGNGLDNRKENLRICTVTENNRNRPIRRQNSSGYKGVCFSHCKSKPWAARITVNYKDIKIGYFLTKELAALAYNEAARKYHGEFAHLNKVE